MVYGICVTEECNYASVPGFGLPSLGNHLHGFALNYINLPVSRYFIQYKVLGGTIDLPTQGDTNVDIQWRCAYTHKVYVRDKLHSSPQNVYTLKNRMSTYLSWNQVFASDSLLLAVYRRWHSSWRCRWLRVLHSTQSSWICWEHTSHYYKRNLSQPQLSNAQIYHFDTMPIQNTTTCMHQVFDE